MLVLPQVTASEQGGVRPLLTCPKRQQTGSRRVKRAPGSDLKSRADFSPRESKPQGLQATHRAPPAFLDEQRNLQFHVERLLQQRRRNGQYEYLMKWRGYPEYKSS